MADDPSPLEAYVAETARVLGLPVDEAERPAVARNLARLAVQAEALLAFDLDETQEPAPVYDPAGEDGP